jgi:hypothetical protein
MKSVIGDDRTEPPHRGELIAVQPRLTTAGN